MGVDSDGHVITCYDFTCLFNLNHSSTSTSNCCTPGLGVRPLTRCEPHSLVGSMFTCHMQSTSSFYQAIRSVRCCLSRVLRIAQLTINYFSSAYHAHASRKLIYLNTIMKDSADMPGPPLHGNDATDGIYGMFLLSSRSTTQANDKAYLSSCVHNLWLSHKQQPMR